VPSLSKGSTIRESVKANREKFREISLVDELSGRQASDLEPVTALLVHQSLKVEQRTNREISNGMRGISVWYQRRAPQGFAERIFFSIVAVE
jgi:hypothetical protein